MPNFCRLQIMGHVGGDCEIRYLPSGDPVANFSVAYTERWKDKGSGEAKERTTWFQVNAWGKLAEIAGEYVRKGNPVMVEGVPYVESWESREGGKRFTLKVRADRIVLLGTKQEQKPETAKPEPKQPAQKTGGHFDDMADDIPF